MHYSRHKCLHIMNNLTGVASWTRTTYLSGVTQFSKELGGIPVYQYYFSVLNPRSRRLRYKFCLLVIYLRLVATVLPKLQSKIWVCPVLWPWCTCPATYDLGLSHLLAMAYLSFYLRFVLVPSSSHGIPLIPPTICVLSIF